MDPILGRAGKNEVVQPVGQESLQLIRTLVASTIDEISRPSQEGRLLSSAILRLLKEGGQSFMPLLILFIG